MSRSVRSGLRRKLIGSMLVVAVAGAFPSWSEQAEQQAGTEGALAAYDELAAVVEAKDIEAFKGLMSAGLEKRMTAEWMIAEGVLSGSEFFDKVPREEPDIADSRAVFFKTYDQGTVMTTYSIEFVREDGRWRFDGYKTSSKAK